MGTYELIWPIDTRIKDFKDKIYYYIKEINACMISKKMALRSFKFLGPEKES